MKETLNLSENEWREILSPEEYHVLREKGTEPPFTGKYVKFNSNGIFICAACGNPLFDSEHKFESDTGWPSFYKPIIDNNIIVQLDKSHEMMRSEVLCRKCGGHLGHVFHDGPEPSGDRFCINSIALEFKLKSEKK